MLPLSSLLNSCFFASQNLLWLWCREKQRRKQRREDYFYGCAGCALPTWILRSPFFMVYQGFLICFLWASMSAIFFFLSKCKSYLTNHLNMKGWSMDLGTLHTCKTYGIPGSMARVCRNCSLKLDQKASLVSWALLGFESHIT